MPTPTAAQITRLAEHWQQLANGEPVRVEYTKGVYYGFCSELAAYRLEHKYNCRPKCEAFYSKPFECWVFRLET